MPYARVMMKLLQTLLVVVGLNSLYLDSAVAHAGRVYLLQAPAWLERDGQREALKTGQLIAANDRVLTGPGARALLKLPEGSLVKLGENSDFQIDAFSSPVAEDGVFSGVLNVLKGAFRFTTTLVGQKRDIQAKLGSATIGIRGTDVWGKTQAERDFVVLIEGEISIERNGETTQMSDTLSLYMAPRGQPVQPIGPVDMDDLSRWGAETEPQSGAGIVNEEGAYTLHLASYRDESLARAMQQRLNEAGYASVISPNDLAGSQWWRLNRLGYASADDARAAQRKLSQQFGFASAWISSD